MTTRAPSDLADHPERPVRWGIVAPGSIAHDFAADLALVPDAELVAVGSRSRERAEAFASRFGAARAYDDYAAVANDPEVDVVYVASPHGRHHADVSTCLDAGVGVLCEKPLTLTARTAAELASTARERGLFLAEAMWMRCNPRIRRVLQMAADGACGEVRTVRADLGDVLDTANPRITDPALGASALMDMGVYPTTLAVLLLGEPDEVVATGTLSAEGVDVAGSAGLRYAGGAVASVSWSQQSYSDSRATVSGPGGRIEIASPMLVPPTVSLHQGWDTHTYADVVTGKGFAHEAIEVQRCLRAGLTESPLLPLDGPHGTLAVLRTTDRIRAALGVRLPEDG